MTQYIYLDKFLHNSFPFKKVLFDFALEAKFCLDINKPIFNKLKKYSIPIDKSKIHNNTYFVYQDLSGNVKKITEFIGGVEYDKMIVSKVAISNSLVKGLNECTHIINKMTIGNESSLLKISQLYNYGQITKKVTLYYEGELSSTYQPHGNGMIYDKPNYDLPIYE